MRIYYYAYRSKYTQYYVTTKYFYEIFHIYYENNFIKLIISSIDIAELRKKLNISQEKLAEMIGVSLRTVQNYESGKTIPLSKHAILRNLMGSAETDVGNTNKSDTNTVLSNMESPSAYIELLEEMIQEKEKEIIRLRMENKTLVAKLNQSGKLQNHISPGDLEKRRETG